MATKSAMRCSGRQEPSETVPLSIGKVAWIARIHAGQCSLLTHRLRYQTRSDSDGVVSFLRVLLRKIRSPIVLIWDGSPIHRGRVVKGFLRRGAAKRLHLEQLPGYAPDLNPDEGIWNYLKRVELANVCCRDPGELRAQVIRARERLRHKRGIICACSRQCGYVA